MNGLVEWLSASVKAVRVNIRFETPKLKAYVNQQNQPLPKKTRLLI